MAVLNPYQHLPEVQKLSMEGASINQIAEKLITDGHGMYYVKEVLKLNYKNMSNQDLLRVCLDSHYKINGTHY